MKQRGRPRLDGLNAILPGPKFIRECIRQLPRHGVERHSGVQRDMEREIQMISLYREGRTLSEIGARFNLTRERIRQLIRRHGVTRQNGGQRAKIVVNAMGRHQRKLARLNAQSLRFLGDPPEVVCAICGLEKYGSLWGQLLKRNPIIKAYINQKRSAEFRGIPWLFTLSSWWEVWRDSRHWHERGRGHGYCMARWADEGPYSTENVYITTNAENVKHGYLITPASVRAEKARATREAKKFAEAA